MNYFDAHEPYAPPRALAGRFATAARGRERPAHLYENHFMKARDVPMRDVLACRDLYDECIVSLDERLGQLMSVLDRAGVLEDTLVIVTSDHGEEFGEHRLFGHGGSLYLNEIWVPLVMWGPGVPGGVVIDEPVSLRDLPATVVELAGLGRADGSGADGPFPGRSLAAHWRETNVGGGGGTSAAFAEFLHASALEDQRARGFGRRGVQMSLVKGEAHYIRDGQGPERIFDMVRDPEEKQADARLTRDLGLVAGFRRSLLALLNEARGTEENEGSYLAAFRAWLEALVGRRDGEGVSRRGG